MVSRNAWMVRTTLGEILGPFSSEELCDRLRSGLYTGDDEVCRSGDYWFRLHERQEVITKLSRELPVFYPKTVSPEDELTQTETETTAILQTDPAHDFNPAKPTAHRAIPNAEKQNEGRLAFTIGKVFLGVLLILSVIRFLIPLFQSE